MICQFDAHCLFLISNVYLKSNVFNHIERNDENKSVNRIVLLIILNALVGVILKSFLVVKPIFTIYFQLRFVLVGNKIIDLRKYLYKCTISHVCSTIDTIGRSFFLVNLTIPFFFFYKFDRRFNECLKNLFDDLKKRMKKKLNKSNNLN